MVFDLAEAHRLLPRIQELTERAAQATEALIAEGQKLAQESPQRADIERRLRSVVEAWAEEISDMGAHAKGLWLVDFDNGEGYWCWNHPEPSIDYQHGYDEGFSGRALIQPAQWH